MRKILYIILLCLAAYAVTYFYGLKITNDGTPYEKQVFDRIKEIDLGAENGIDINKATKWDFIKVYGIGESIAEKIIKYREEIGGFRGIEDLLGTEGIGEKRLDKLREIFKIEKEESQNGNN